MGWRYLDGVVAVAGDGQRAPKNLPISGPAISIDTALHTGLPFPPGDGVRCSGSALFLLTTLYIAPKSGIGSWKQNRAARLAMFFEPCSADAAIIYLVILMTFHDVLVPRDARPLSRLFEEIPQITPKVVANIRIFYNVGAVVARLFLDLLHQALGRRKGMIGH